MSTRTVLTMLVVLTLSAACATTGSTFRSGVGDTFLEHPPYAAGTVPGSDARIVRLPIEFQRAASQDALFDPPSGPGSSVAALVAEMNAFLDSIAPSRPLSLDARAVPPNVYFGCERDGANDCVTRGDSVLGRRGTTMRLAVERPSPGWIASSAAIDSSATHLLVIHLEVGQYWTRQTGLRGAKSVELGVENAAQLPWLTSLEAPVSVLQLTGALVDRQGRAKRIAAEGIIAQSSPLTASALGAQRLISPSDVERARSLRNSDAPGNPLVWRVALCRLLSQLGTACTTSST